MDKSGIKPADRFGQWTVLSTGHHLGKENRLYCYCVCDCGYADFVSNSSLLYGRSKHCSHHKRTGMQCKKSEFQSDMPTSNDLSEMRIRNIWKSMLNRCYNPNDPGYGRYGKRGITVCDEWKNSTRAFYDWAVSNGYADGLSIDRIDGTGSYCPENCRWATHRQQQNNIRTNRRITFNGKTQTMAEWAREKGMTENALYRRLQIGWSVAEALTRPINDGHKYRGKHPEFSF